MQLITLASSGAFARLKWTACGAAGAVALWLATVPPVGWLAGLAALVAAGLAARMRPPCGQLRLHADGACDWQEAAAARPARMRAASAFAAAGWIVLGLAPASGRARAGARLLVIAADAATAEELRQLRVWLRLAAPRAALNSTPA